MNQQNELLFQVALEFLKLSDKQKTDIGMRLGLINLNAMTLEPGKLDEVIFSNAYRQQKVYRLMEYIGKLDATEK